MPTKEAREALALSSLAEPSLALERGCLSAVGSVQSVAFFFFSRCCVTGNRNRGASADLQTGASWAFKVRAMLMSTPSSTGTMAVRSGFHSSFSAADWFHRLLYPTAPTVEPLANVCALPGQAPLHSDVQRIVDNHSGPRWYAQHVTPQQLTAVSFEAPVLRNHPMTGKRVRVLIHESEVERTLALGQCFSIDGSGSEAAERVLVSSRPLVPPSAFLPLFAKLS